VRVEAKSEGRQCENLQQERISGGSLLHNVVCHMSHKQVTEGIA
jgi:hypothetical protein